MYQDDYKRWLEADLLDVDLGTELRRIEGDDEIVTIQFKSVGLKKVIAGMTKLVKLSKPLS